MSEPPVAASMGSSDLGARVRQMLMAREGKVLAFLSLAILLILRLMDPEFIQQIRAQSFDYYQAVAPREAKPAPVIIVEIDEASLEAVGQWPWPRHVVAQLLQNIGAFGPAAVGLDILFPEADRLSASALAKTYPDLSPEVKSSLEKMPSNDVVLAKTMAQMPVVLGMGALAQEVPQVRAHAELPPTSVVINGIGAGNQPQIPSAKFLLRSLPLIDGVAAGRGLLAKGEDLDGVVRRVPLAMRVGEQYFPSLSVEMLRVALGETQIRLDSSPSGAIRRVGVGEHSWPTDQDGQVWVHFSGPRELRYLSALTVLKAEHPEALAEVLSGRMVLVGATAAGLGDLVTVPTSPYMPGVEVHAQILENVLIDGALSRPHWAPLVEITLFLAIGLCLIFLVPKLAPRWSFVPLAAAMPVVVLVAALAYGLNKLLLDITFPIGGNILLFPVVLGLSLALLEEKRRKLSLQLEEQKAKMQRLEGELAAARAIQMGILPQHFPVNDWVEVHAMVEPAKSVGGDLYDCFMIDDNRLFFMIGDVSGKGVPASLFMALTKALYKSSVLRYRVSIEEIMTEANIEISRENPAMLFVTAFAGILELDTGKLDYCNAGHEPPFLRQMDGTIIRLEGEGGPPLCVLEDFPYPLESLVLEPGASLCVFTDGVSEAYNPANELYGVGRTEQCLAKQDKDISAQASLAGLVEDLRHFVNGADPSDDITIITLRYWGSLKSPAARMREGE